MSRLSWHTREDGASALEFALVAPLIVMLIWGMVELGGLFNTRITLTHAAREGVRAYALGSGDPAAVIQESVPGASVTASGCPNGRSRSWTTCGGTCGSSVPRSRPGSTACS
jgi:Flp pilus assembly pilin Flp